MRCSESYQSGSQNKINICCASPMELTDENCDDEKFKFIEDYCQNEIEIGDETALSDETLGNSNKYLPNDDESSEISSNICLNNDKSSDNFNNSFKTASMAGGRYKNQPLLFQSTSVNTTTGKHSPTLHLIPTTAFKVYPLSVKDYSEFYNLNGVVKLNDKRTFGSCKIIAAEDRPEINKNQMQVVSVEKAVESDDLQQPVSNNCNKTVGNSSAAQDCSSKEDSFPPRFANRKFPRYFGDIELCDLGTPKRAQLCLDIGKRTIDKYRTVIKKMRTKERSVRKQISSLEQLIKDMQKKDEISDSVMHRLLLKVSQIDKFDTP